MTKHNKKKALPSPSVDPMMNILNQKKKKKSPKDVSFQDADTSQTYEKKKKKSVEIISEEDDEVMMSPGRQKKKKGADTSVITEEVHVTKKKKKKSKNKDSSEEVMHSPVIKAEKSPKSPKSPKRRAEESALTSPSKKSKAFLNHDAESTEEEEEMQVVNKVKIITEVDAEDPGWSTQEKLKLIAKISENLPKDDLLSYRKRLSQKVWVWDKVCFEDKTADECEKMFYMMIHKVNKIKTLAELLTETERIVRNPKKKNLNNFQVFIREYSNELKSQNVEKTERFKLCIDKWGRMSNEEKSKYIGEKEFDGPEAPRLPYEVYYHEQAEKLGTKNSQVRREMQEKYKTLKKKTKVKYIIQSSKELHDYQINAAAYQLEVPSFKVVKKSLKIEERTILLEHLKIPKQPAKTIRSAFYHEQVQAGMLDDVPNHEKLIISAKNFRQIPEEEQTRREMALKEEHAEFMEKYKEWLSDQEEHVKKLAEEHIKFKLPKEKKEKVKKVYKPKPRKIKVKKEFDHIVNTSMLCPKFGDEPKRPPKTGYLLFVAKFEQKMQGKFDSVKEKSQCCKEYWNKLPKEHQQAYGARVKELKEDYGEKILEYVKSLKPSERKLYVGFQRKTLMHFLAKDVFEEKYPNLNYPVFKSSPNKKVEIVDLFSNQGNKIPKFKLENSKSVTTTAESSSDDGQGQSVSDSDADSDSDAEPEPVRKQEPKPEVKTNSILKAKPDDSSDSEEENNAVNQVNGSDTSDDSDSSESSSSESDDVPTSKKSNSIQKTPITPRRQKSESESANSEEDFDIKPSWLTANKKTLKQKE